MVGVTPDANTESKPGVTPTPFGCVTNVSAGHQVFDCDGIKYDVEISPTCAKGGCGLVLDVHGMTMSGPQEDASTQLSVIGAARGYVVVQPTAPGSSLGPSWTPETDDDKVWKFVGDVRAALAIDSKRVHVTGFSQGGAMSFRFACKHGDEIASAAPIAAASAKSLNSNVPPFVLDCAFDGTEAPARPMSILHMHGIGDGLVPIAKGREQRDRILAWLGSVTESVVSSDGKHTRTRYASAVKNVVYEYIEHDYAVPAPPIALPVQVAGHCFPGGADLVRSAGRPLIFSCEPPVAFVWGSVVMDFFEANPMR
jgi:polyhydroxybutyrate depolymerase